MDSIQEDVELTVCSNEQPSRRLTATATATNTANLSFRELDYIDRQRRNFANLQAIESGADYDYALGYGSAPLGVSNATLQLIDIIMHVVGEEASILHILANVLIILWVCAFLFDYCDATRWRSVTAGVLSFYLVLMLTFFGTNGFTNDRGAPRTMAWLYITFTITLSGAMQFTMRKIRPQTPEELETIL